MNVNLVFVYGTLKRGFPNHDEWMKPYKYIADSSTKRPFRLVVGEKYFSPILMEGDGNCITGELYEVSENGLAQLDIIESVGKPLGYKRILIDAVLNEQVVKAWIYLKDAAQVNIIHNELAGTYSLDSRYIPVFMR